MKDAIIFDIDGTLADCQHRRHHIELTPKDWKAFNSKMHLDPPHKAVVQLFNSLWDGGDYYMIIVSGRSEDFRKVTEAWLSKNDISYNNLYMRPSKDSRPDTIIKLEILKEIQKTYNVLFAIDDRNSVVKMWRENGITCFQCAEGDF